MGQLEQRRYLRDRDAAYALRRQGGMAVLTRWIGRVLQQAPHADLRRVELVDRHTIVVTTFSGLVATVAIDPANACRWCGGSGRARAETLERPPCEACMGSGLAHGERGSVAVPSPCASCGAVTG